MKTSKIVTIIIISFIALVIIISVIFWIFFMSSSYSQEEEINFESIDKSSEEQKENSKKIEKNDNNKNKSQIANPASVYCKENGGELEIREGETGQYGVCILSDGTECEEWKYFRGECGKKTENNLLNTK